MNKYREIRCSRCDQIRKIVSYKWLRLVRVQSGLSLRRVAKEMKVSPTYVSQLELGKQIPTARVEKFYEKLGG